MNNKIIEFLAWVGALAILATYALATLSYLSVISWWFLIGNSIGPAFVALAAWKKKAYQPAALNLAWTIFALISIAKKLYYIGLAFALMYALKKALV